jgi:predicted nucleic acid-binding protein
VNALPIAVLDTSVLIPAWSRIALQRLATPPERRYQPLWSEWIIGETWRALTLRAVEKGDSAAMISTKANAMMRRLLDVMTIVSLAGGRVVPANPSPLRDPDDAPIWATAVLGGADFVVSHNTHHFPAPVEQRVLVRGAEMVFRRHLHGGIEFLTAIEFIEGVLGADATLAFGRPLPPHGVIRSRRAVVPA